jgi:hypothetical protein
MKDYNDPIEYFRLANALYNHVRAYMKDFNCTDPEDLVFMLGMVYAGAVATSANDLGHTLKETAEMAKSPEYLVESFMHDKLFFKETNLSELN